jgi:Virulence factor Evf
MEDRFIAARRFFADQQIGAGTGTQALAPRSLAPLRSKSPDSQFTYIVVQSQIPAGALDEFNAQRQYLIDLAGIATAYVQKECIKQHRPEMMWDADLWERVFTNLPMGSKAKFERAQRKESVEGNEIATQFVAKLSGMNVPQPELSRFIKFLGEIRQGIKSGTSIRNEFGFASIAITLAVETGADKSFIQGWLGGTFIKFLNTQQIVTSRCATNTTFDFDITVTSGLKFLEYGKLVADLGLKKGFDDFIQGTQLTAIEDAESFFQMEQGDPLPGWGGGGAEGGSGGRGEW